MELGAEGTVCCPASSTHARKEQANASVPMLAVVRSAPLVGLQVVLYAWATVAASLLLIGVAPMGVLYSVVAMGSGGWFIVESHRLYQRALRGEDLAPMRVFHSSITYLTLLFLAVGIDPLLPW